MKKNVDMLAFIFQQNNNFKHSSKIADNFCNKNKK